jgi:hypothetical protein
VTSGNPSPLRQRDVLTCLCGLNERDTAFQKSGESRKQQRKLDARLFASPAELRLEQVGPINASTFQAFKVIGSIYAAPGT